MPRSFKPSDKFNTHFALHPHVLHSPFIDHFLTSCLVKGNSLRSFLLRNFLQLPFYFVSQRFRHSSWHTISKTLRARGSEYSDWSSAYCIIDFDFFNEPGLSSTVQRVIFISWDAVSVASICTCSFITFTDALHVWRPSSRTREGSCHYQSHL